jgi:hypothetical protein
LAALAVCLSDLRIIHITMVKRCVSQDDKSGIAAHAFTHGAK